MRKAKAVLYFVLWIIPAVVLSAGYIVVADRVCHVDPPSKQHGQQHEGSVAKYADIDRYRYHGGAEPPAASLKLTETVPQESHGADKAKSHDPKAERWITKFFCEAKALDVALVLFTYCLVIVTGWLVYATVGLRKETAALVKLAEQQSRDMQASIKVAQDAAKAAAKSADAAERGVIAADRPWITIKAEMIGPLRIRHDEIEVRIKLTLENIGRSPALSVDIGMAQLFPSTVEASEAAREAANNARLIVAGQVIGGPVLFPHDPISREIHLALDHKDFAYTTYDLIASLAEHGAWITGGWPAIAICVYYLLPTEGRARYSTLVSEIKSTDRDHVGFDGSEGDFSDVTIVQSFGGKAS